MVQVVIAVFVLLIGFSSYRAAKRQGQWSWLKFLIAIVAAVAVPLLCVLPLVNMPWLKDKPVLATVIMVGLIFVFVGALVYFMRKFFPTKKSAP